MEYLAYLVLFLTYLGLGLGYLPGYRMNRAAIALSGAARREGYKLGFVEHLRFGLP